MNRSDDDEWRVGAVRSRPARLWRLTRSALAVLVGTLTWYGCTVLPLAPTPVPTPPPTSHARLVIYADAALETPLEDLKLAFYHITTSASLDFTFAEPPVLRQRLEATLRPEMVITRDQALLSELRRQNRIEGEPRVVARDPLAIIIARTNPGRIERLEDLTRMPLRVAIAADDTPLGQATRQLIENLSHDLTYGPDFPGLFYGEVVSQPQDGSQVLQQVIFHKAHVGIVYISDLGFQRNRVELLEIPPGLEVAAEYQLAVLKSTQDPARVQRFADFLLSRQAGEVWREYGLQVP